MPDLDSYSNGSVFADGDELLGVKSGAATADNFVLGNTGDAFAIKPSLTGDGSGFVVEPTINNSGTDGYTACKVNAVVTAAGSGTKLLQDWQVGGTSRAQIQADGVLAVRGDAGNTGQTDLLRDLQKDQVVLHRDGASYQFLSTGGGKLTVFDAGNIRARQGSTDLVDFVLPGTPSSGDTGMKVAVYDGSSWALHRVTEGAADSGGSGFKVLRVPN